MVLVCAKKMVKILNGNPTVRSLDSIDRSHTVHLSNERIREDKYAEKMVRPDKSNNSGSNNIGRSKHREFNHNKFFVSVVGV